MILTLTGTSSADTLANERNRMVIDALAGNDTIENSGGDVTVDGGEGNDRITSSGSNVSISGGVGNDSIVIDGDASDNTINAGDGNDTIHTNGQYNVIQYKGGKDIITGFGDNDIIEITSGSVTRSVQSGADVSITIGSGSANVITLKETSLDSITVEDNLIRAGDAPEVSLSSKGDTTIISANNVVVYALEGNDKVTVTGNDVVLNGEAGKDTLIATGNDVLIDGGEDADRISISSDSENMTLIGGAGADTIYTNGLGSLIKAGEGKDVIVGFGEDDSIEMAGEISKMQQSGSNVLVTVDGSTANVVTIRNTQITDLSVEESTIFIYIPGVIELPDRNDNESFDGKASTIYANGGNDTLEINASDIYVDGGAGNDRIILNSDANNTTIIGGADADTIWTNGKDSENSNLIQYDSGKDVIYGFGGGDSIKLASGSVSKSVQSGADVSITIGSGSANVITLKETNLSDIKIEDDVIIANNSNISLSDSADTTVLGGNDIHVYALGSNDKAMLVTIR